MGIFTKQKTVNRVVLLPIGEIAPSPYQPRRQFDPKALDELAQSIQRSGLLQPISVRPKPNGEGYELIAGERRLLACKRNGMEQIQAIIQQVDDQQAALLALVENLQRRDLNYFEEARGIQQLMKQANLSQQQVAEQLGKAQSTIANKLRLLAFSPDLQRKILDHGLTERHARALLRLPNEQLVEQALAAIIQQKLNVGATEALIQMMLEAPKEENQKKGQKPTRLFVVKDLRVFMNTISKAVSTMKMAGIQVDTKEVEDEEYIHYTVNIPKKSVYRSHTA